MNKRVHRENKRKRKAAIWMTCIVVLAIIIWRPVSGEMNRQTISVTVKAGQGIDDLYALYGEGDLRRFRYEVRKANGLADSGIRAGQTLILPAKRGGI